MVEIPTINPAIPVCPTPVDGMAALLAAHRVQGVAIDQWGVVHDGIRVLPGVVAALQALRARHIPVVMVSNSDHRAAHCLADCERLGLPPNLLTHVVTSGDVLRAWLGAQPPWPDSVTQAFVGTIHTVYLWGDVREHDQALRALHAHRAAPHDRPCVVVDAIDHADALITWSGRWPMADNGQPQARAMQDLRAGCHHHKPLIVLHPKPVWHATNGKDRPRWSPKDAGTMYDDLGGRWYAPVKPLRDIFKVAAAILDTFDRPIKPIRRLMVGDSLVNDIHGAAALGWATLWVGPAAQHHKAQVAGATDQPQPALAAFVDDRWRW